MKYVVEVNRFEYKGTYETDTMPIISTDGIVVFTTKQFSQPMTITAHICNCVIFETEG